MKITFLGTGSSLGTPIISCKCDVCTSEDSRDKRLRSSVMIEIEDKTLIIDAGPDFREQMLKYNTDSKLDAVLITHAHRDHIAGLDDIRPFNFIQNKAIRIYAEQNVIDLIHKTFFYSFGKDLYKYGTPKFDMIPIDEHKFYINGIEITPIRVFHSMPMLGFRIKNFAYITDAKKIEDSELKKLKNLDTLVINALRLKIHPSHFNLEEALNFIQKVNPRRAYLTHMSHRIGKHSELEKILPPNVSPAFDGLII